MAYSEVIFCDWAATKLMEDLRKGNLPDQINIDAFSWPPLTDCIWAKVTEQDKSTIIRLLARPDTELWGILLCRALPDDQDINNLLISLYEKCKDDKRTLFLFHALSYRKMTTSFKEELASYLINNLSCFLNYEMKYFGGPASILDGCYKRMNNPKFFDKRWVYLFTAHGADDAKKASEFIEEYLDDPDAFVAKMAGISLNILNSQHLSLQHT